MQSSTRPHDSVFLGSPEFRDGDAKSGASLVFPCAANEDVPMEKDTLMSLVGRRLVHVELTSIITVTLLYGIALVSAWLLSLVVRVHGDQFPSGALTPLQLTAFSLCFFAVGLHSTNVVYVWLRCSCEAAATLRAACEVSAYLLLFFVCDRTTLLERRPRVFNADVFFFLVFAFAFAAVATARRVCVPSGGDAGQGRGLGSVLLPVAAAAASVPPPASVSLLDRHHVEEWVGWVQLIYVMYGYFHNVHIYRMMRVCVSSYAFLTAFVNYARYDSSELSLQQSVVMLLRSLWKLNFVVVATCALLRNQYMLYHICAVQSFVTVAVYLLMNVGPLPRSSRRVFGVKVGVAAVLCCVLWDMPFSPEAFALLWSPMQRLVRYDNPIVDVAPLHEWLFRSGLDHWIWLVGVLVASRAPLVNRLLRRLDGQRTAGIAIKVAAAFAAGGVLAVYVYLTEETSTVDYNRYLPYLSWVPILSVVTLRCIFRSVRCLYAPLYTFLGTVAVEAYVAHNHVFMATTGPNGGPLYTLRLLPGDHPLCDFGVFALVLLGVSYRLSVATSQLQQFMLPHNASLYTVGENFVAMAVVAACTYSLHRMWCARTVHATNY